MPVIPNVVMSLNLTEPSVPIESPDLLPPLPPAYHAAAAAMPTALRRLLVENASPEGVSPSDLVQVIRFPQTEPSLVWGSTPGDVAVTSAPGSAPTVSDRTDVAEIPGLLSAEACAALRAAADTHAGKRQEQGQCSGCGDAGSAIEATDAAKEGRGGPLDRDTVDGAEDHQLNLTTDASRFRDIVGEASCRAIHAAARSLDVRTGGSGGRPLPLVEAFVRRYTPDARPWHPFHQDRAYVTVNVALSPDAPNAGGRLVALFPEGAVRYERTAAGDATVHLSRAFHGVTRLVAGVRYSLILFFGDEPAVRRRLVREKTPDGRAVERWTRVIVQE